jgi:hypothetical protein
LQLEFGFQASNEGRAEIRVSTADTPITATADAPAIYEWDVPLGEIYPRNAFRRESKMGDLAEPFGIHTLHQQFGPAGRTWGDSELITFRSLLRFMRMASPSLTSRSSSTVNIEPMKSVYAKEVLTQFMTRAWRRDLSDDEIQQKLKLFHSIREQCDSFEDAMLEVLATVLSSPKFLYVVREDGETGREGRRVRQADQFLEEGSDFHRTNLHRLSLFLWCSIPDDTLQKRASSGELADAGNLRQEVDRMLQDPRAERFAEQFVHQWLDMQLLDFLTLKNADPNSRNPCRRNLSRSFMKCCDTTKVC